MTGEIIISDTIQVQPVDGDVYRVSASVMGASDTRAQAKTVNVLWNQSTGSTTCKNSLIAAYIELLDPPEDTIRDTLIAAIGTVIPE